MGKKNTEIKYLYLVERKADGEKFVMIGNFNNPNIGLGRYLFPFVQPTYRYARPSPYGLISNVACDDMSCYNSKQYRVVHCTRVS